MAALYLGRFGARLTTAEAARNAYLEVIEARRRRGDSVHPASWAGFVAIGDWR